MYAPTMSVFFSSATWLPSIEGIVPAFSFDMLGCFLEKRVERALVVGGVVDGRKDASGRALDGRARKTKGGSGSGAQSAPDKARSARPKLAHVELLSPSL